MSFRDIVLNRFTGVCSQTGKTKIYYGVSGAFDKVFLVYSKDRQVWYATRSFIGEGELKVNGVSVLPNPDISDLISQLRKIHVAILGYWVDGDGK